MHFNKVFLLATAVPFLTVGAQQADSTKKADDKPAAPTFSGTIFANYMYQTGKLANGYGGGYNSFNFERAYFTVQDKLSDKTSVRVTTDVYGSGNSMAVRLKYAYLQYDYFKGSDWSAVARGGLLHTAVIDHEEHFWPRWIQKTPTDLLGYFSAADYGVATLVSMPNKMGEIYAVVSNGNGYSGGTADKDRYKDYEGRVTITPLASSDAGLLKTLDLSGWYYKGATAGDSTAKAEDRDRFGFFAGIKDPRLVVGLNYSQRKDGSQLTATTDTSVTGRVMSAYTVIKPFQLMNKDAAPLGVVLRYDQVKLNTDLSQQYSIYIAGLTYDLSKSASLSVDYQEQASNNGAVSSLYLGAPKAMYMHMVINY